MSRMMGVGLGAVLVGLLVGAVALKLWSVVPGAPPIAVVDLAGIVERQRVEILQKGKDPEAGERLVQQRMIHLAAILAELGQKQVILNKAAVVSGTLPDLTDQVESRLSRGGVRQ